MTDEKFEMDDFELVEDRNVRLVAEGLLDALDPETRDSLIPGLNVRRLDDGQMEMFGFNRDGEEVMLGRFDPIVVLKGQIADAGQN